MNFFLYSLYFGVMNFVLADEQYLTCQSPQNEKGLCKPLSVCKNLHEKFSNKEISISQLRRYKCGSASFCCVEEPELKWLTDLRQKVPQPPHCGSASQNRIFGGSETEITDHPWTVLLHYKKQDNTTSFECAGTLISDRYVVTAAHCIVKTGSAGELFSVRLGEWDQNSNPDCVGKDCAPPVLDVDIVKDGKYVHPEYDQTSSSQSHDIALLRLTKKVKFNDYVKPICLPLELSLREKNFTGSSFDVAGWGVYKNKTKSSKKLKITMKAKSNDFCKKQLGRKGRTHIEEDKLCVGGDGQDTMKGDSGGGLTQYNTAVTPPYWFLAGVVCFGDDDNNNGTVPGVYTKTSDYLKWFSAKIRK